MKNLARRRLLIVRLMRPLLHIVLIVLSFWMIYLLRQQTDLIPFVQLRIPEIDFMETALFALMAAVIFLFIGVARGVYELFKPIHNYYKKFLNSWLIWLVVISFVAFMGFGFIFTSGISRFILLVGAVTAGVILTVFDAFWNKLNSYCERKAPYRVLVCSAASQEVIQQVKDAFEQYTIYDLDEHNTEQEIPRLSKYDILIVVGIVDKTLLQEYADAARIAGCTFYHIGETLFLEDLISLPQRIGPIMALEYKASPLDGWWRVVKRLFDIVVAFFALLFLFPLLLLIALAIKLDTKGPVLYVQQRVGKNKRSFRFVKFRSMYTHLSTGSQYGGDKARAYEKKLEASDANVREGILTKIENDPRVTPVGRFLRKSSLDELPSLWSVLIGKMSLVGPRPHMPHEVDQYDLWQERLFSIKPGITGYAQLFGRDNLPFEEEAKLDLYYIQNRSVVMDLFVIVGTIKVVFSGR